ncbi:hypothetical protein CEXT_546401 [Caerostris extrusa]|uniref:Uncharacterized protein n=1 Tax=Caerostris extrusa TaxID=172846 RepID=A0AAV4N7S2_CAEEX|nr:hypothetical protein CEXT_546401 [Caerostris extrusa]
MDSGWLKICTGNFTNQTPNRWKLERMIRKPSESGSFRTNKYVADFTKGSKTSCFTSRSPPIRSRTFTTGKDYIGIVDYSVLVNFTQSYL